MTALEFIDEYIRPDIGDTLQPYQWNGSVILERINAGQREIAKRKPAALYVGSEIVIDIPADLATTAAALWIAAEFHEALRFYVDAALLAEDKESDTRAAEATQYLSRYERDLA